MLGRWDSVQVGAMLGALLAALKIGWQKGVKVAVGTSSCPGSCRDGEGAGWGLDAWQKGMDVLREAMVLCGVTSTPDRVRVQRSRHAVRLLAV